MSIRGTLDGVVLPLVLALVPGWGHIWLHRKTQGLFLFMLFAAAVNCALVTDLALPSRHQDLVVRLSWGVAAAILAFSVADVFRSTILRRRPGQRQKRVRYLRKAIMHYLRDEVGQAEEALAKILRFDPRDATALVYLGMLHRDAGRTREAKRAFERALAADQDGRWRVDVRGELAMLRGAASR